MKLNKLTSGNKDNPEHIGPFTVLLHRERPKVFQME